ncbi:MAG: hypothetical protein WC763_02820 [Candidatus Paceibacterota bacterium]|jgi:hypothetical protein
MSNSENATSAQLLQVIAKFAQTIPVDADRREVQKAIEDNDDPFWVFLKERFAKKAVEVAKAARGALAEMVALGRYDWVSEHINEKNFPPESLVLGSDPKVFHFNRYISSEDAIAEMEKKGYRPATLGDLLDYGAKNPEEQREYPIVALGSVAVLDDGRRVACLGGHGSARRLSLHGFDGDWGGHCRFLAVRK